MVGAILVGNLMAPWLAFVSLLLLLFCFVLFALCVGADEFVRVYFYDLEIE